MKKTVYAAVLLIAVFIMSWCGHESADEYAFIMFITGDVKKNNAEAHVGDLVAQNDVISTDAGASCDIRIGKSAIRMKSMSSVHIFTLMNGRGGEKTEMDLSGGEILCQTKMLPGSGNFFIRTPAAVIAAHGTQFTVENDNYNTTTIRVFSGEVRVIKRVKRLDSDPESIFNHASLVNSGELAVVTADEARDAEKTVERIFREETTIRSGDMVIDRVINRTSDLISLKDGSIRKFSPGDSEKGERGYIEVEQKSEDDLRRISMAQKQDKNAPAPEGRLVVTRGDIYLIKDGRVAWTGRIISDPARRGDRLFIAAGKYVFCAMSDGPVVWRKEIENDGKISMSGGIIKIRSGGKIVFIDGDSGNIR